MKAIKVLLAGICALLIASCGSKKSTVEEPQDMGYMNGVSLAKVFDMMNANKQTEKCMTSRMNLSLNAGVKKINVGGSIKMKRDDVIQVSLVAFGVVEAGRLEFTKDYMLMVDRIGHKYVKVGYKDITFFKNAGIDFFTFQSLFWDELFLLGDSGVSPSDSRFRKEVKSGEVSLTNSDSKYATLTFVASALNGLIKQTCIASPGKEDTPVVDWKYQSYGKLGKQEFPAKMNVTVNGLSMPIDANITLSHIDNDSKWETRTELSKRYEKVDLEAVLSRFMSLTL